MLTRRAERRGRPPPQPVYDDFKPPEEWVQEPSNYIFRLYLPQVFKKEDLNITYDQSGKITVRGRKLVGEYRFARFESSYNVPKDSILENVRGKLENNILSLTIPKIVIAKPSEEKKEEPVIKEKPTIVAEKIRKDGDDATVPKEKQTMDEKEKKEQAVIKEKKEELVMKEPMQRINEKMKEEPVQKKLTTMEEKKEEKKKEPVIKEKPKMVAEKRKEEDEPSVPKEKPTMTEERKEEAMIKEKKEEMVMNEPMHRIDEKMKQEPIQKKPTTMEEKKEETLLKTEMDAKDKIKEAASLKILNEKLQTMKEPNMEERKNEPDPNEMKKEESILKEKLKNFEEKNETIQKDKPVFDGNKREDSTKKDETWEEDVTGKPRYCHETEVQEKQPKERESTKRKWLWNEEDKGWLDWLDCAFRDEVLKRVCRNKKLITLALVAVTTGFYISRKLRRRG